MESDKILNSAQEQNQDTSVISGSVGVCEICGKPIYDLVYAECQNCGKLYHPVCLKKKSTVESCRHHHLTLRRQEKVG
jgi:methionyl-tRNA synthetase